MRKISFPTNPVTRFLLLFGIGMAVFYIIYKSAIFNNFIGTPIVEAQANLSTGLLNVIGENVTAAGTSMKGTDGFAIDVKGGCDGLEATALLLVAILMFPIGFKYKIPGIIFGGIGLLLLNLLRIAGLYLAGNYGSEQLFNLLHEQGGFVIFTALSIVIWLIWANWAMKKAVVHLSPEKS